MTIRKQIVPNWVWNLKVCKNRGVNKFNFIILSNLYIYTHTDIRWNHCWVGPNSSQAHTYCGTFLCWAQLTFSPGWQVRMTERRGLALQKRRKKSLFFFSIFGNYNKHKQGSYETCQWFSKIQTIKVRT